jgi:hypothetical protein
MKKPDYIKKVIKRGGARWSGRVITLEKVKKPKK